MQTGEIIETIKVKPWGKDQGDFVEINAEDFDPSKHKKLAADPLDHDSNGEKGGSEKGAASTAAKGRKKKGAAA